MVVCSYFLRGQCRFGDKCRNEHPQSGTQSWVNPAGGGSTGNKSSVGLFSPDSLSSDITLGKEKPFWPLSSYGPAKCEPSLVVGLDICPEELRVKAWEAKTQNNLNGYMQYESNQIAQADSAYNNARNNLQTLYDQAIKQSSVVSSTFPASSSSAFPPSTSAFTSNGASGSGNNPFGPSSSSAPSIFGATSGSNSVFGASTSTPAFATGNGNSGGAFNSLVNKNPPTSVFGAPSTTSTTSAFGQPSVIGANNTNNNPFGKPPNSVFGTSTFGQPSTLGSSGSAFGGTTNTSSVFGTPSTTTTSVFGQPSAFGSSSTSTTSAFGANTTTPNTTSAFGQTSTPTSSLIKPATSGGAFAAFASGGPSAFGSSAPSTSASSGSGGFSAFAGSQPSAFSAAGSSNTNSNSGGSVFGQPSALGGGGGGGASSNAFGGSNPAPLVAPTSAFGALAPASNNGSAFGGFGQSASTTSFGQSTSSTSVFGQPAPPSTGATSAFGQPLAATSAFSQMPAPTQSSAFSALTNSTSVPSGFGAFGSPSSGGTFGSSPGAPAFGSVINANNNNAITSTESKPDFDAPQLRNLFRPGKTPYDSQLPPNYLESILPKAVVDAFKKDRFDWGEGGGVPEWIPPVELR